mmetsp:Transcript_26229/g.61994  ORF Transcript_26229/g.61994 Transcript_26229/m.61994 type:complete len:225 (-) Transcript_26229:3178-3852(-)
MPTGSSCGRISARAVTSASSSSAPPTAADSSTSQPCSIGHSARTRWGETRPTKATMPVWATAAPVASANATISSSRISASRMPSDLAVASPSVSASSAGLASRPSSAASTPAVAITATLCQPSRPVLPSKKACIARSVSGTCSVVRLVSAFSTTPTTTPASSRRRVCSTPRASSSVRPTPTRVPMKATPVSPTAASSDALGLATPVSASATATASSAPEALPSR